MTRRTDRGRVAAVGLALLAAVVVTACSSTASSSTTTAGGGGSSIPSSAFSDHTGVTASTVTVGNVSTLSLGGLFKGAPTGVQAYFDYVNSTGGVDGRKLEVAGADDGFTGSGNKQATQNAITNDFALVGSFSLEESYGGSLLAADPGMPDISNVLDQTTYALPNVYSPSPLRGGWQEGPLQYFKHRFPGDVTATGALVADLPSAEATWSGEKYVMQKVGYKIVYDQTYGATQTNFDQNVVAMKNAGVKVLFVDSMAETYASALLKALQAQDFHPVVVLGAATYTDKLIADSGGPSAVDGDFLEQGVSLYLGQDQAAIPAVGTFLHWVGVAAPGFTPDYYTLMGWLSAQIFADALARSGSDPSRGALLTQLGKIDHFDGEHIVGGADVAAKMPGNCYIIGQITSGKWQRLDDPPTDGPSHGYRCDYPYVIPPS